MSSTEYSAKVTEIIDETTGGFDYPESFDSDVEACFLRRLDPKSAAEKLLSDYQN